MSNALPTVLLDKDTDALSQFMKRRQMRGPVSDILKTVKEEHESAKGSVTAAKSATYEAMGESIRYALNHGLAPAAFAPTAPTQPRFRPPTGAA